MIWTFLYWILLTLAVLSALYALLWDRPGWRGRPQLRCRKCWYDLTDTPGDLKDNPIQCPECGKEHPTRKSMRKTNRSKRWLVIACSLWLVAYAAHATPKVQKNGWAASIPSPVLVATFPFLSEQQGTGLPSMFGILKISVKPTKLDQLIQKQVTLNGWRGSDSDYNWFARRLVFILARLEPDSLLTDGTTAKGLAYKTLITKFVQSGHVYDFERTWAQSVVHIEFDIDQDFGPGEHIRSNFNIRRLLLNRYRLTCGDYGQTTYHCSAPSGLSLNGLQPIHETQAQADQYWIKRLLWDYRYEPERARGRTTWESKPVLGTGTQTGPNTGKIRISMQILESETPGASNEVWKPVHRLARTIHYAIDPARIIIPDASDEVRDHIQNQYKAKLSVQWDRQQSKWVPYIQLVSKEYTDCFDDSVLFGGMVSIRAISKDYPDAHGQEILNSGHDLTWWRLGWKDFYPPDIDFSKIEDLSEQDRVRITNPPRACYLTYRAERTTFLPGEVKPTNFFPSGNNTHTLIVRIQPMQGNTTYSHGGLWADRIYTGSLDFQLDNWTLTELKRYIVNGTVPDHAMP